MASTSLATVSVGLTGDVNAQISYTAASNPTSPTVIQNVTLSSGNNTYAVPSGATRVTIHKPSTNTQALLLKGATGDTGFGLHLTDPDSVSTSGSGNLVINAAGTVAGVILVWT